MSPAEFFRIARRPRWIGVLLAALAIAAAFAALGQWQLERSFEGGDVTLEQTETVVDLVAVTEPQEPMPSALTGQKVSADVRFVDGDYLVLEGRKDGYWVVGHGVVEGSGASLAVAVGLAATRADADAAISDFAAQPPTSSLEGRYVPTESPQESDFESGELRAIAVSELINLWSQAPDGVYGGYLVSGIDQSGLAMIDAPPPSVEATLNLLNFLYAVEWVIFGGFAIFLWYRLVKDAWEEEQEEAILAELDPAAAVE
jgi:surfeit locus 1 family protein